MLDAQQMRQTLLVLMSEMVVKDELLERLQREVAFKQSWSTSSPTNSRF